MALRTAAGEDGTVPFGHRRSHCDPNPAQGSVAPRLSPVDRHTGLDPVKIAVTGKGGVGKTTLTALLARAFVDQGYRVLAIDADPSPCLGQALGIPPEALARLEPIARMEALIYERTGAQPGSIGGYFKLNPRVDDLPDQFSVEDGGGRLPELGAVGAGGAGWVCPESAGLRALGP